MSIVYSLVPQTQLDGNPLVASLLVLVGFLLGLRLCHGVRRLRHVSERVLILGGNPLGRQIIEEIERRPQLGYAVVGVVEKDRKSTRLNSSHLVISYAVFCLKKKKKKPVHGLMCSHVQNQITYQTRIA